MNKKKLILSIMCLAILFSIFSMGFVLAEDNCSQADYNQDGTVDTTDLVILAVMKGVLDDNLGRTNCNETNGWCNGADYNQDGTVDTADLVIFAGMKVTLDAEFGRTDCNTQLLLVELLTLEDDNNSCNGADFNRDGTVDTTDLVHYAIMKSVLDNNFGRTDCNGTNNSCDGADYNQDGTVDTTDLVRYAEMKGVLDDNFGRTDCNTQLLLVELLTLEDNNLVGLLILGDNNNNNSCNGADYNQDGTVDTTDLLHYAIRKGVLDDNLGRTNCNETNEWCNGADYNQDGTVDTADLVIFAGMKDALDEEFGRTDCNEINSDNENPIIDSILPIDNHSVTSDSLDLNFEFNVSDENNIDICILYINESKKGNVTNVNQSNNPQNISVTGLTPSTSPYSWYVNCTNSLNNTRKSEVRTFIVNSVIVPSVLIVTPTSTGGGSGGGGGGRSSRVTTTQEPICEQVGYVCDSWSDCVNDRESRDCTRRMVCGTSFSSKTIKEVRSCTSPVVEEPSVEETTTTTEETTTEDEGGFAAITGAVTGAIGRAPWVYGITFLIIIGGLLTSAYFFKSKKKKSK